MAITGPFTKVFNASDGMVSWTRTWSRQTRPRVLRLPFRFKGQWITEMVNHSAQAGTLPQASGITVRDHAYNAAFGQFQRAMAGVVDDQGRSQNGASLGVSIAQKAKAIEMISKRALQLSHFFGLVRRGKFGEATRVITNDWSTIKTRRNGRKVKIRTPRPSRHKSFADNVLEFQFGWAPLVGDIDAAVKVLAGGIPASTVRGRGFATQTKRVNGSFGYDTWTYNTKCQIIADVFVDNPNLNLANQLGLVNLPAVLWDAVPWSFVVDWVSNVGTLLTSWVGWPGTTITGSCVTYTEEVAYTQVINPPYNRLIRAKFVDCHRLPNGMFAPIAGPKLVFYPFKGMSVSRGLSAISLLLKRIR